MRYVLSPHMSDLGGWTGKALDMLKERVDNVQADVRFLMGKTSKDSSGEPRVGGIGIATWVAIVATVVVPIVLAIIFAPSP